MNKYENQTKMLVAVDCVIVGFNGTEMKLLVIKRGFEPKKGKWSLMGGFVQENESFSRAANRILYSLTGLRGIYLEQLHAYGNPERDPVERTISVAYFALVDITQYERQLSKDYKAEWKSLKNLPDLIFDHNRMVDKARQEIKYKAANHPILFELLPDKFTIPQLQNLYEAIYEVEFDRRNFSRKVLSTKLLIKTAEKDKSNSKKGAYYYKLDNERYAEKFRAFLSIIPNPDKII